MTGRFRDWGGYLYPGTGVLRNKRDYRDAVVLRDYEEQSARARIATILLRSPIEGALDRGHMKNIHSHVFGIGYASAGEAR